MNIIDRIKYWWWGSMELWEDLASIFIPAAFIIAVAICSNSCSTIKEIPVQTIEKIEYRDSIVYVTDSVLVEVPVEKIVQVLPQDTISILRTSVALSEAKIDKGMLHHSLEQKGAFLTQIDTFYITQIKEVEKLVEVPIEVVKTEYKRDGLFWYLLAFHIIAILYLLARLYFKR